MPMGKRWGGCRRGAGRKLVARRPSPAHRTRPRHVPRHPVLVTLRARDDVPSLRGDLVFEAVERSLLRASKDWFRVVHFSVQTDHVHLIVEADSRLGLIRGVQGLAVRCAKALNRELGRRGAVWSSRYHARRLTSPREVRKALVYVLLNFRKHLRAAPGIDPCSSGPWFDGWADAPYPAERTPLAEPRTWLLRVGWRLAGGPISLSEGPVSPAPAPRQFAA